MSFSVKTMALKVLTRLVTLGVAWLGSHGMDNIGVTVDPNLATLAIFGALEAIRNFAKVKLGWKFL